MNIIERLRARLIAVPKPGTKPRQTEWGESITIQVGGEHKAGDDAGLCTLPQFTTVAAPPLVQEHVYAVEPLCEEAAQAVERYAAVLRALMTNPHIDLGDQIYTVREHEGEGWDGPSVKMWSDAVSAARKLLQEPP